MGFIVSSGGEVSSIPSGIYVGKLTEKKPVENEYNGEKRQQYQLKYQVIQDEDNEGENIGEELLYWVNRKINSEGQDVVTQKSNMLKVIAAHEGIDQLPIGFEGDLDDYIDSACRITVTRKKNQKGEDRPYITAFTPAPKKFRRSA